VFATGKPGPGEKRELKSKNPEVSARENKGEVVPDTTHPQHKKAHRDGEVQKLRYHSDKRRGIRQERKWARIIESGG